MAERGIERKSQSERAAGQTYSENTGERKTFVNKIIVWRAMMFLFTIAPAIFALHFHAVP